MHTGLGFDLWLNDYESVSQEEDLSKHNIFAIKTRLQQEYTAKLQKHMSVEQIAEGVGMTPDEVRVLFTFPDQLDRFEKALAKL